MNDLPRGKTCVWAERILVWSFFRAGVCLLKSVDLDLVLRVDSGLLMCASFAAAAFSCSHASSFLVS